MDLKHPFISWPRLAVYYFSFWLVAGAITIFLKGFYYDIPAGIAAIEFFSLPFLFALAGTAVWYIIKFSTIEDNSVLRIFLSHLIGATVIVLLWLYTGTVLIKLLHPDAVAWIENRLPVNIFLGYMLYTIYVVFFYAVNYYKGFTEKLRNEGKMKGLIKEAELHALKSQINPHFLFNSLNSISSLTMTDPEKAREMVINLSDLMRYSLKHEQDDKVLFREELENNQRYLRIEKVRFGKKLNPVFDIGEGCPEALVPNMILQPLYENAIKYGVYEATQPVDIVTRCRRKGGALEVTITNRYDPRTVSKKGEGIGLRNIRDRLRIIYNNPLLMNVEDNQSEFRVSLVFPQK